MRRSHVYFLGGLLSLFATLATESASAAPTVFKTSSGWKQFYGNYFGDIAAQWDNPYFKNKGGSTLLDVAYLGSAPSNSCATAPASDYLIGACFGQCVDLTARWFAHFVYANLPESDTKVWGNGGDPICQCAAGKNGCPTKSSLYEVHWPGDKYMPIVGDVLSFSYTHAALVINTWSDASGTHMGIAQQNVSSLNVVTWYGDHFVSESCVIHAVGNDRPATGTLDAASCSAITGTATDADVPTSTIDVYFDGPQGAMTTVGMRSTTTTANHAYAMATPVGLMDGTDHQAFAYALSDKANIAPAPLGMAKHFVCAPPKSPFANPIKRPLADLKPWRIDPVLDVAHWTTADVDAVPTGDPLGPIVLVHPDDTGKDLWIIDGDARRAVTDAVLATWGFSRGDSVQWPRSQIEAHRLGTPWPDARLGIRADKTPDAFVLDEGPPPPPTSTPSLAQQNADDGEAIPPVPGCQCDQTGAPSDARGAGLLVLGLGLWIRRRRRGKA
jgi:MYXO-CTERM domain-containing protein